MVDLPEPEPPTSAVILPGGKIPLKLYRTWTAGLRFRSWLAWLPTSEKYHQV